MREETPTASPGSGGATPDPDGAGEQHREVHPHVFVLDTRHRPLQPCHPARARKLLANGRAAVHRHTPFTIRLKDHTAQNSEVDGVELGIDPGSSHTGLAVFTNQAVQGIHHKYVRLLQRADGYGYTTRKEGAASSPGLKAGVSAAKPS